MAVKQEAYFTLPSIPWIVIVTTGMYIMFGSMLKPSIVPYSYLGPIGTLAEFLKDEYPVVLTFFSVGTLLIHFLETLYCMKMCGEKNISYSYRVLWFLSTMLYGGLSLVKLSHFKPGSRQGATKLKD